jgi:enoyl-CoA hydratase/carnithine racemase
MSITIFHRPDGIAVLTLDQPGSKANVLSTQLWNDLDAAAKTVGETPNVKGAILASAKPGIFIAGADLKLLGDAGPNDPRVRDFIALGNRVLGRLESLPFATIAAIDGAALGGGLEVALACDFRLIGSNPKAQLGLPEVTLGLIPGWGGTQRLPRLIGLEKSADMLCTGKSMNGAEAVESDLALGQMSSEELIDAAAGVLLNLSAALKAGARTIKQQPVPKSDCQAFRPAIPSEPQAVREAMLVLTRGAALPLKEALPLETEAFLRLAGTEQSKEKIAAFFNRKK